MNRSPALYLVIAALASCARPSAPPAPAPQPIPTPVAPRPQTPAADWRDAPVTPGDWVYRQDARGSLALFGAVGQDAALTLRCDRAARMIYVSRASAAPAATLTFVTTSLTRGVAAQTTAGTPPYLAAALSPNDPLLDAMAFSRGRFAVQQPGEPRLIAPAWAEVGRVIEDCRP